MKQLSIAFCLLWCLAAQSQNLPFKEIPVYPEKYNAGSVAARVIDGLGFRYYWATDSLTAEDLKYKPGADARTIEETLQHIHFMSYNIVNATKKIPSESSKINSSIPFSVMREETLNNLKAASDILKANGNKGLEEFDLVFKNKDATFEYPFWNLLNGPIADAIWHVGQIVSFRRSSGNPFNSNVSVLTGKVRDAK